MKTKQNEAVKALQWAIDELNKVKNKGKPCYICGQPATNGDTDATGEPVCYDCIEQGHALPNYLEPDDV